jgi:hypothetical protein
MKNILAVISLLILWSQSSLCADLKIPPRPKGFVCDYAHLLGDSASGLDAEAREDNRLLGYRIYTVTVPEAYVADMDTFGARLCRSWHICGDDSATLLLISGSDTPSMRLLTGRRLGTNFTPEITAYILDNVSSVGAHFGTVKAVSIYMVKTYLQIRNADEVLSQTDFINFDKKYRGVPDPATYVAPPGTGRYMIPIAILTVVCMLIMFSYLMMYRGYKSYLEMKSKEAAFYDSLPD